MCSAVIWINTGLICKPSFAYSEIGINRLCIVQQSFEPWFQRIVTNLVLSFCFFVFLKTTAPVFFVVILLCGADLNNGQK